MKKFFLASALALVLMVGAAPLVPVQLRPAMAGIDAPPVPHGGIVVIQATLPGGLAADCADTECRNGPVAKAIVAALENPQITVASLFDRVNADTLAATDGRQVPWMTAKAAINVPLAGDAGHSLALVIGNGAYKHVPALTGAPRDGVAVGEGLKKIGFQTVALIDSDREPLAQAVGSFLKDLKAGDTAVIYYSGHGFSVNGVEYLPSLATEVTDDDAAVRSSMAVDKLIDVLSASKATRKVLILDTHYPALHPARVIR
jgi:uncharacterized caspase-like protein